MVFFALLGLKIYIFTAPYVYSVRGNYFCYNESGFVDAENFLEVNADTRTMWKTDGHEICGNKNHKSSRKQKNI